MKKYLPFLLLAFPSVAFCQAQGSFYSNVVQTQTGLRAGATITVCATSAIANSPTGATESGTTATITTIAAHGFVAGQIVQITGVSNTLYNGQFTILTVPTTTTFTYTNSNSGLAASGQGAVLPTNVPCSPTASIFSDIGLTAAKTNPTTTDGLGNFSFYAAPGLYVYSITGQGILTSSGGPFTFQIPCIAGQNCVATGANNAFTGNNTHSGTETFKQIGAEIYPSGLAGATCGDKIIAAIALLPSNGGTLKINNACGTGTGAAPWAAITSSLNFLTLDFIEPGNYFSSGITLTGVGSGIRGLPCASPTSVGLQCPVHVTEGNGLNLPALVTFSGGYNSCRELVLDGNNTNNPTGGAALKVPNNSPRYSVDHCAFQNAATHGIWISGGAGNTSCCGKIANSMESNNNGDAILIQESSDLYLLAAENEGFGINPIVNTQNAATGGCAANCVTWVSGPKWSTDASLVGTAVRLNNVVGQMFYISSIQSQTVLTLTSAPGTQASIQMNNGNAIENRNSGAMRAWGGEISSTNRGIDGLLAYCGGGSSSGQIVVDGVALGNNDQNDIEFLGSDPANQTIACMFSNVVVGNKFGGGAVRTPDAIWSNIFIQDGGQHVLGPNVYTSNATPHSAKYAVQLTETASGRASGLNQVSGNTNTGYNAGVVGWIPYSDGNLVKSGVELGVTGDNATILSGMSLPNNTYLNALNNAANPISRSIIGMDASNNVHIVGDPVQQVIDLDPSGIGNTSIQLFGGNFIIGSPVSNFFANTVNTLDLGIAANPFRNLWLGTAATSNFKFQPAATAAARTVSIPDPGLNVNLAFNLRATSSAFATATTAGTCVQNTTAVAGATTSMVAKASPVSTPGVGAQWSAVVSSAGNVTITECAVAASAGGSIAFNIEVTP